VDLSLSFRSGSLRRRLDNFSFPLGVPIKRAVDDGTMDPLPSLPGPTTQITHYKYYGENIIEVI